MAIYPDKKNGKLTGRFRVEIQLGGRRLRGRADSHKDAKRLERELLARLESGEDLTPAAKGAKGVAAPTIAECIKSLRGILWKGMAEEGHNLRKLEAISSTLGPHTRVNDIDINAVDRLLTALTAQGLKDGTINRYVSALSVFLKACRKRGYRTVDVPELEWRKEAEHRIRWITPDEEKRLLTLLAEPYSSLAYVAIRTGLRAGELLGLTPQQVEPAWIRLWKTKNGTLRSVPITPQVYKVLAPIVSKGMPTYRQLQPAWDKARKAMGLMSDGTFVFHACRHTYATRAIEAGVNPVVLQKLMGHKTIQTTLRYAHVDDKTLTAAALAMDAKEGDEGRGIRPEKAPHSASTGASRTAEIRRFPDGGVSPYCPANPRTPVRFRLGPPTSSGETPGRFKSPSIAYFYGIAPIHRE